MKNWASAANILFDSYMLCSFRFVRSYGWVAAITCVCDLLWMFDNFFSISIRQIDCRANTHIYETTSWMALRVPLRIENRWLKWKRTEENYSWCCAWWWLGYMAIILSSEKAHLSQPNLRNSRTMQFSGDFLFHRELESVHMRYECCLQ